MLAAIICSIVCDLYSSISIGNPRYLICRFRVKHLKGFLHHTMLDMRGEVVVDGRCFDIISPVVERSGFPEVKREMISEERAGSGELDFVGCCGVTAVRGGGAARSDGHSAS